MNKKLIELINVDAALQGTLMELRRIGNVVLGPYHPARRAIQRAWLQWQIEPRFEAISDDLIAVVHRTGTDDAAREAAERDMRGLYEWLLLNCAVLSGDTATMRFAAGRSRGADPASDQYQHYHALAGVLRARIVGDRDEEQKQMELSGRYKADGVHPVPSRALLRAFVGRDHVAVERDVVKGAKKYWGEKYLKKAAVMKDEPDHMIIDVLIRDPHFTWPYVEAVIAKLAILDGAKITYDDVWFPLALVTAVRQ